MSRRYLETIKAVDGKVFHLKYHQSRLNSVLNSLGVATLFDLDVILRPPLDGLYRCRLVYDSENIEVEYFRYIKKSICSLKLVYDDFIEYSKKYENREDIDRLLEQKDKCDDILIVKNGLITDTSIANIAFYDGRDWVTPKNPLLFGTTRQRLVQNNKIIEKNIRTIDIKEFKKVALMNAMIDFDIIAQYNVEDIIC